MARPSDYTQELADKICEELASGKSLRSVTREESMPAMSSVFKWLRENKAFSEQYVTACEERVESQHENLLEYGEEAVELAQSVDFKASSAVVSAVKLKSDNLKWSMSKMKPKKYGDKMDVTSDGKSISYNVVSFRDKDDTNSNK